MSLRMSVIKPHPMQETHKYYVWDVQDDGNNILLFCPCGRVRRLKLRTAEKKLEAHGNRTAEHTYPQDIVDKCKGIIDGLTPHEVEGDPGYQEWLKTA